ncbi:cytochrome aa3 quinol oxidase subunit IV [Paenibacillus turicensis]|uniref:Quinol oxidase subunit 4 n=1 Tax=Paenibacillus turicensis TaxID=160487 RepID=A0ABS4FU52_9BACL|nr:cytochrome aa3 quinol oxidase subunit IV [Paenibacillus turicensis]MBP1906107.1 cytochrome aa3-600 menaquinol oxidase subunit 4 [Paenibacillus turicensis]
MKKLFPLQHVMGYVFSLILSAVALLAVFGDLSYTWGLVILLVCAMVQMGVQLFLFMHISENRSRGTLYVNIAYAMFVALVTIFGTLFAMIWGYNLP